MSLSRRLLAAALSALLLCSLFALPYGVAAEGTDAMDSYVVGEFKYTALGSGVEKGVGEGINQQYWMAAPVDLTALGAAAEMRSGAAITAPGLYLQMDINAAYTGSNNLVFLQPHSNSSLLNAAASAKERAAMEQMAGEWYTVSAPIAFPSGYGGNNDGIDLSDIRWMTYFIPAVKTMQVKNMRIVQITDAQLRQALTDAVNAPLPNGEDGYLSLTDYNAAKAQAQTLLDDAAAKGDDLMTAYNLLKAVKATLVERPTGVYKDALQAAIDEEMPAGEFGRVAVNAYQAAKDAGQAVVDDVMADQAAVDAALQAILDAKAALKDVTYLVARIPAVGDDVDAVASWTVSGGNGQFYAGKLSEEVDLSLHDSGKLRFRWQMRVVDGDAATVGNFTSQPKSDLRTPQNFENDWFSPSSTLADGEWHTFERDFTNNIQKAPDTWQYINTAAFFFFHSGEAVTLEMRSLRVVDTTMEESLEVLRALTQTAVGDADLYPGGIWQNYQSALADAQSTLTGAVSDAEVWQAIDALQAALDELGNRGILMEELKAGLDPDKTYSRESLAALDAAKAAAEETLMSETATNEDINAALQAVRDAKAALVETTFLAGQFPIADTPQRNWSSGVGRVENGVFYFEGTAIHVDSPAGLSAAKPDLGAHDRSKLYMQFDIWFEEDSASSFQIFFIRPTRSGGGAILNHEATASVNAAAKQPGKWHTVSIPLNTTVDLDEIAGMSFYMFDPDTTHNYDLRVTNFRIVDLSAEPVLNTLFASGMMFQQNKPVAVFGQGGEGQTVTAALYKDGVAEPVGTGFAVIGADGCWHIDLPAQPGGYDTYTLTVSGGSITYTYTDILIGEVWVAGGQSNMENHIQFDVNNTAILEHTDPYIRIFYEPGLVYGNDADQPLTPDFNVRGAVWDDSTNVNRLRGASSIAYRFSQVLREELDVPVGFLNVSLGGTFIEAWISREEIASSETVKSYLQERNRYYDENNWPQQFNRMSTLYNQKIGALSGYNVAGTLWYQGETNLDSGHDVEIYTDLLELLQRDWGRTFGFGEEEMPFIFAHIAPHTYNLPGIDQITSLAYFWEAMSDGWARHPDSMAQLPIYDLPLTFFFTNMNGQAQSRGPIHPADKIPVAERFAAAALNLVYGGDDAYSAPTYRDMQIVGDRIRVTFDQAGSGLRVKAGDTLHGFAVAGEDGVYVSANARIISADTVEVYNERVIAPENVTYAFTTANTGANLVGGSGIAAAPFRTDRTAPDARLYHPKDWQYADGQVWIVGGGDSNTGWFDVWQSDKATLRFDSENKVEGVAALAIDHPTGTVIVSPVYGLRNADNSLAGIRYLTVMLKNPDVRDKELRLRLTQGAGTVYHAALADDDSLPTRVTLPAGSDFTAYTFDLGQLLDARSQWVTADATIDSILSAAALSFVLTDTAAGTVYLDDIRFGRTALAAQPVEPQPAATLGDVDGDGSVSAADALLALQASTGKVDLTGEQTAAADVDGQPGVTAADALMILQAATGKIDLQG